ncbi:MAG TPA: TIGR00730 family Rossman fold protein [Porphyromonadaceae bacterium]|nr:TIGR00730 family Rossman fold protein [Porphyromonadaceae bacterium]
MESSSTPSSPFRVVVYCASSSYIDKRYTDAATRLGQLLAEKHITCITGAGKQGLMGAVNDAVLQHGGQAIGIIPRFMVDSGWCHSRLSELQVTETMHIRKSKMAGMSDAAIALPGGMGTLEELAELITWKQLGLYKNPIVILNIDGYYTPLLDFFEKMIREQFMPSLYRDLWFVATSPEEAVEVLQKIPAWDTSISKYPKKEL